MKRYLLFCYQTYYPYGGWSDFQGDYDTEVEALKAAVDAMAAGDDHYQVVDTQTGRVLHRRKRDET